MRWFVWAQNQSWTPGNYMELEGNVGLVWPPQQF